MGLHPVDRIVGGSPAIAALREQIRHLAAFDTPGNPHVPTLLLQGETGTGKGLVARAIHDSGARAAGPFVDVNCAAIPEHLLEAELYGFEAGAFTDARRAKPGLFETASRGTLFLDEIDALPLPLQAKLLRSIEDKRVRRLGAVADLAVDVKIIAAAPVSLAQHVTRGRFRADLYHRLTVVVLEIPPLRQRGDDVLELADHFLRRYATAHGMPARRLGAQAADWLRARDWSGNVRELGNLMERIILLDAGTTVEPDALERLSLPGVPGIGWPGRLSSDAETTAPAAATAPRGDEVAIRDAIARTGGNVLQAARLLGLSRNALRYRMLRYGIGRPGHDRAGAVPAPGGPRVRPAPAPETTATGGEAPAPFWERKPVAVLAIELTFSPAALRDLPSPEPWTAARRWETLVAEKVEGFGGVLLQRHPSLYTALFGLPRALDRMPQRALHAALALRHAVDDARVGGGGPSVPTIRLGVHAGEVLADAHDSFSAGRLLAVADTLALPARLLAMAAAGDIVISAAIRRAVARGVTVEARALPSGASGANRAAEGPERPDGYVLTSFAPVTGSGDLPLTPFVGRQRELADLGRALELTIGGRGQVVAVVGEAGVGKSRLCAEFCRHARHRCLILEAAAPSPGRPHAFLPVIEMLKHVAGISARDDEAMRTRKLTDWLRGVDERLDEEAPYLLALLGLTDRSSPLFQMDPDLRRRRTLEALKRLLVRQSLVKPVVLLVEDLHWLDDDTLAFLDALVEAVSEAPLLLLVTCRPEHRPAWSGRSAYVQVRVDPLGASEAEDLLICLVGDAGALTPLVLDKAQGNPFFIEEIVQSLVDQGMLGRDDADDAPVRVAAAGFEVPPTIQGVIAARIDRLPDAERRLLQALAVLGPAFAMSVVERVMGPDSPELRGRLARLQAVEFIHERPTTLEPTFAFKHALTRDVAYASLPGEPRRRLHARAVEALEALFPDRLADHYDALAHHCRHAGMAAPAVHYLERAGQQAVQRSAYGDAIASFTTALDLLSTLPETAERNQRELQLRVALGAALMAARGLGAPEVETVFSRARDLCRTVGDTPQLFQVLQGLAVFYALRVKLRTVEDLVEERRRLAERLGHRALALQAQIARGHILLALGDVAAARTELDRGLALYDHRQHHALTLGAGLDPSGRDHGGLVLWLLGYPDRAVASVGQALAVAEEQAHPFNLTVARLFAAMLHQLRREPAPTRHCAATAIGLATRHAFPMWRAMGLVLHGWAGAAGGDDEGLAQLRRGIDGWRATGAELVRPYFLGLLAGALAQAGRVNEGLATATEALETARATEERWWEAELLRLTGELRAPAAPGQGEELLLAALDVARRQQAKSLELRAATSLARLRHRQGRRQEALDVLAPVHGWFTEGFDTPDLREATALLDPSTR